MADILIRGMEMPEYCYECPLHNMESGYCQFYKDSYLWSFERPARCPLIPLPAEHGRLIDGDELQHIIGSFSLAWEYGQGVSDCFAALLSAPTIIKAEGETGES